MIYNRNGQTFEYKGRTFVIGQNVEIVNCIYEGLKGYITDIFTGLDKDTDNPGPDIYCNLHWDENPEKCKKEFEKFKRLTHLPEDFKPEDINLQSIILAPEMIIE